MTQNESYTYEPDFYEPIDLCACYEPTFLPPVDFMEEYEKSMPWKYEPTLENTSYYVTEPDGTKYFYCGNTRIKITEHFSDNGKSMETLVEDVIQFAGTQNRSPEKDAG